MYIGAHPLNPANEDVNKDGSCEPLVPPVLMEGERRSRCSYCFNKLKYVSNDRQLMHNYCSTQCKDKDTNRDPEENAVRVIRMVFPNVENPPPTVVLVYRILRYSVESITVATKLDELC